MDSLLVKLEKFDPKLTTVQCWFRRYEYLTKHYDWSNQQHLDALSSFFDSSLSKIFFFKVPNKRLDYETSKNRLIHVMNILTASVKDDSRYWLSLKFNDMIHIFEEYQFSRNEIKYWIVEHFDTPETLRIFYQTLVDTNNCSGDDEMCIYHLKHYFCIFIHGFEYTEH